MGIKIFVVVVVIVAVVLVVLMFFSCFIVFFCCFYVVFIGFLDFPASDMPGTQKSLWVKSYFCLI